MTAQSHDDRDDQNNNFDGDHDDDHGDHDDDHDDHDWTESELILVVWDLLPVGPVLLPPKLHQHKHLRKVHIQFQVFRFSDLNCRCKRSIFNFSAKTASTQTPASGSHSISGFQI